MTTDPRALLAAAAAIALIGAIGVAVVLSDQPATNAGRNARHQAEQAPPLAETITGDGSFIVGKHVKAGTYRTAGGPRCTWARLSDLTGDATSDRDRGTAPGRTTVDLVAGVAGFETHGCPEWVMVR